MTSVKQSNQKNNGVGRCMRKCCYKINYQQDYQSNTISKFPTFRESGVSQCTLHDAMTDTAPSRDRWPCLSFFERLFLGLPQYTVGSSGLPVSASGTRRDLYLRASLSARCLSCKRLNGYRLAALPLVILQSYTDQACVSSSYVENLPAT